MIADALSIKTVTAMSLQHSEWRLADDGTILAQLTTQPILNQMMISAQKNDVELQKKVQMVRDGDKTDFFSKRSWKFVFPEQIMCAI